MKKTTLLSLFILGCSLVYTVPCFSFTKETDAKLETTIKNIIDEYNIPGAVVGVWIPSKGEWTGAFGLADKETKEKMKIDDHFKVDHLPITLIMIGFFQLLDEGKVSLNDKISQYIKNIPNGDKITLGQLIDRNSSQILPSVKGFPIPKPATTLEELKENMKTLKTHTLQEYVDTGFEPHKEGERYVPNFMLLALVIEKVSGMSLEKYFEKNIFEPLKLQQTSIPTDYANMPKPFAHGYTKATFNNVTSEVDASIANPSFFWGASVSSLPDLKILAQAVGTGSLLSKDSFKRMQEWRESPQKSKWGLGMGFDNGWLTPMLGIMPGYESFAAYLPKEKAIFVCLINADTYIEKNGQVIPAGRFISREIVRILDLPLMDDASLPAKEYGGPTEKGKGH